jgi:hypothetical protein
MGVTFSAILNKITTTVDGGWRVTFDVPDSETPQMAELSKLRSSTLQIGIVDLNTIANKEKTTHGV